MGGEREAPDQTPQNTVFDHDLLSLFMSICPNTLWKYGP